MILIWHLCSELAYTWKSCKYEKILPITLGSEAFNKWVADLEKPEGLCRAHYLLHVRNVFISSWTSSSGESWLANIRYLNMADQSLTKIARCLEDTLFSLEVQEMKSIEDIKHQFLTLADCLKRYVEFTF